MMFGNYQKILEGIERLEKLMSSLSQGFSDLQNAIAALTSEEGSVVSTIQALQAQIAAGSPVTGDQLEALVTQVNSVSSGLAAAIAPPSTSTTTGTSSAPAVASAVKKM
jgi:conjugal transfer/entry exclusion protein